jgi:chaperonin cofactor prefoldin
MPLSVRILFFAKTYMYFNYLRLFIDCNKKLESLKLKIESLTKEEKTILDRQTDLKKDLYAKFGDSINLET